MPAQLEMGARGMPSVKSFDITGKAIADCAKDRKSQVTFSAFNSGKIASVEPALRGEFLLSEAKELTRVLNAESES
jgi:hypothetical protein